MTFEQLVHAVWDVHRQHGDAVQLHIIRGTLWTAFEAIGHRVLKGDEIAIPQFGTFYLGSTKARRILNPVTREPMRLTKTTKMKFRAAGKWRRREKRGNTR